MKCKIVHNNQSYLKKLTTNVENALAESSPDNSRNQAYVAVQWGKTTAPNGAYDYICNTTQAIGNATKRLRMFRILKLNGIEVPAIQKIGNGSSEKIRYQIQQVHAVRSYRVFVFQFQTLIMYRSNDNLVWLSNKTPALNNKFYEVPESENRETQRVARMAERAIYSLGLDFGSVWIGISSARKQIVLNVDANPTLTPRREQLYRNAIVNFVKQYTADLETTSPVMGADLEFMFKNREGKMVLASKYFSKKGKIGCDARTINRNLSRRPLAEIRPDPSSDPEQVVENIRDIMRDAILKVNSDKVQWLAGSMPFKGYSIGGHIHFSNVKLNSAITRALDNYLAVPLVLIEEPSTAKQRRIRYGFLGDVRTQFHGGFEYRTLGSWVLSPQISKAVLFLSQFIVKHYTKLDMDIFYSADHQRDFYTIDREQMKIHFRRAWAELEQIPGFFSIQRHVNIIPEMIEADRKWDEKRDFKAQWGFQAVKRAKSG